MKCPVCDEEVDMFDICDKCGWQNSGPNENENENNLRGPNEMTLIEARENYKKGKKVL